ncbi:MAG: DUF2264 domain-containing protein [Bacteroidales bacterium]|jgi:hypothetical protein|nr:DUF2264 domain-containing protein [Bacteroidales bacterium]
MCQLDNNNNNQGIQDRNYWVDLLYNLSIPILKNMSRGELKQKMLVQVSTTWDNRNKEIAYFEAFGRLMSGLSPWLCLQDCNSKEISLIDELKRWSMQCYLNAVDENNPDYLLWDHTHSLVDAAYIVSSFIRAPEVLWQPLDNVTKQKYIHKLKKLREISPPYNNWLLFRAIIETFLLLIDEEYDGYVLTFTLQKMNEWYVGDGWYSDGPTFSMDYYNSFVIHPMLIEIIEVLVKKGMFPPSYFNTVLNRMNRYNELLERMVSPEATFPIMGRSIPYRMGVFHSLALSSWKYGLPQSLSYGQIRNMLTSVMKKMFSNEDNFDKDGFLQLGFMGYQPNIADHYTNTGSLYMTALTFLPLGLPVHHEFWLAQPEEWTSQKVWSGKNVRNDGKYANCNG